MDTRCRNNGDCQLYMLGIPGETKDDIERTLTLHEQLQPEDFGYFVFYPYPGTSLFQECKDKGYLPGNYYDLPANHRRSILMLPDLSKEDIDVYYSKFTELRIHDHMKNAPEGGDAVYCEQVVQQMQNAAAHG